MSFTFGWKGRNRMRVAATSAALAFGGLALYGLSGRGPVQWLAGVADSGAAFCHSRGWAGAATVQSYCCGVYYGINDGKRGRDFRADLRPDGAGVGGYCLLVRGGRLKPRDHDTRGFRLLRTILSHQPAQQREYCQVFRAGYGLGVSLRR